MKETRPTYRKQGNIGLFDSEETIGKIYSMGNPLDKLSFRDFLGLASGDKVPDEKTTWAFKEDLTKKGLFEQLFDKFNTFLGENNLIMREGVMIDGSFVEAPRQRNTREGGTCVRVHGRVPSRNVQPCGRLCAERGLQHPDKPGLQPVPVRASITSRDELTN